jgi:hypothetical protein
MQTATAAAAGIGQSNSRRSAGLTVYRGAELLGYVLKRRAAFEAISNRHGTLGLFNGEHAASVALLDAGGVP